MSFTVQQIGNDPIILGTFEKPLDPERDVVGLLAEVNRLADPIPGMVTYIGDTSRLNLSFSEVVQALAAMRGMMQPNKFRYIIVDSDEMTRLAATAAKQQQYGGLDATLVSSVDEALKIARQNLPQ